MDKSCKGFTFTEVLIAAAVIAVIFIPVISVFYSASLNQIYSFETYKASAQAELALTAAVRSLNSQGIPVSETETEVFLNDDFLMHDEFDFIVIFYTSSGAVTIGTVNGIPLTDAPEFSVLKKPGAEVEYITGVSDIPHWDVSSAPQKIFTDDDGGKLLIGIDIPTAYGELLITVDVYNKEGKFLIRTGQVFI